MAVKIWERRLRFESAPTLFSPRFADPGTLAMLSVLEPEKLNAEKGPILDLGCGYGLVGVALAGVVGARRIVMVDQDPTAARLARANATGNGAEKARVVCGDGLTPFRPGCFARILCNPPYHVDFSVPRRFIEDGYIVLKPGGAMTLVVKRRKWYYNKLEGVFGNVSQHKVGDYFVLTARRPVEVAEPDNTPTTTRKHQKRMGRATKSKRRRQR